MQTKQTNHNIKMSLLLQDNNEDFFCNDYENTDTNFILLKYEARTLNLLTLDLIDRDLLDEIKLMVSTGRSTSLYFGTTLRDMKFVIQDENGPRQHEIFVKYKAPKKLVISSVQLPYSPLQDREYKTVEEVFTAYQSYVNELSSYFFELERIDSFCMVMEPLNPSFKDDFRRILLDDRTWLHIEVTPEGLATNIHLVGNSEMWHDMLQSGLLTWDHDKDIVENIMSVFDITEFPVLSHKLVESGKTETEQQTVEMPMCGICLCDELPDNVGVPQPLCQNPTCGVYFHRNCLYQWLVACSGSRPPAFGVATGACPTCLQPISCSEKDT